jgi:peptidyl-dipeptidase Dcp
MRLIVAMKSHDSLRPNRVQDFVLLTLLLMTQFLSSSVSAEPKSSPASKSTSSGQNALLSESSLPYHLPPFDKIKDDQFVPAIEAGMREHLQEAEKIAANPEKPTFDNTVVAMERSGRLLDRAYRIFSNLNSADTNPARQEIEKEIAPKLAAHNDEIFLNGKLFARVQEVYDQRDKLGLDPESSYLLERYSKDFTRAGAKLPDADKTKLKALNTELATLQTTFEQNVLKEKNASSVVVKDRADLTGLSESDIAAAVAAAKDEHKEGAFVIRLQNTSGQPVLRSMQNRPLRERIMQASLTRNNKGGEFDNRSVVIRIAQLRA